MDQARAGAGAKAAAVSTSDNLALMYEEILTSAARVKSGRQPITDVLGFRDRIRAALQSIDGRAARHGYDTQEVSEFAKFAAVAFLDEAVLTSSNPNRTLWGQRSLQVELFSTAHGGEEFFERLDQLLRRKDSPELADVLEVYLLCLQLGFEGQYATRASGELRIVSGRTLERIRQIRGRGTGFSPDGELPEEAASEVVSDIWLPKLMLATIASLALAVITFIALKLLLGWKVESVLEWIQ